MRIISMYQYTQLHFFSFLFFCSKNILQYNNLILNGETFQTFQPNKPLESTLIDLWTFYLNDQLDEKDTIRRICIPTYTTGSQLKFLFISFIFAISLIILLL